MAQPRETADPALEARNAGIEPDVEAFRVRHKLGWQQLADRLDLSDPRTAQRYALGEVWPRQEALQAILDATDGEVTLDAMHKRRMAFLREQTARRVQAEA